ncbi:hypothetical protein QN277_020377 [Acacia crassicarpa]|uniref:Endonuclease/exonuclease/phosphatase domain-containing protein n=1 Tax=Acacia crassicarpa TaxID=499986 RepID=A0AAE1KET4_9FABA|nr:hypothetical protein QN277_020377 [Acacia crassicarpa]
METKSNSEKVRRIRERCGFDQEVFVEPIGLAGGLSVWWQNSVSLTVLYKSKNIIHVLFESNSLAGPAFITFVYGPPKEGERRVIWELLRRVAASMKEAWLVVGDFNDLLSQMEKEGGNPRSIRKIINFQSYLSDCNLIDLEFKGSKYTWCNKRPSGIVREMLDRALSNMEFRESFERAMVFHVEPIGSDHHVIVVDCCYREERRIRAFKFEANWTQHDDFM